MSKKVGRVIGKCVGVLLIFSVALFGSWGINCALFALICRCFDWAFSWEYATGVWLVVLAFSLVLRGVIASSVKD